MKKQALTSRSLRVAVEDQERSAAASSFEFDALVAAKKAAPELPRGLLIDEWHEKLESADRRTGMRVFALNPNYSVKRA